MVLQSFLALIGVLALSGSSAAQCSRSSMASAVDLYLFGQQSGQIGLLPVIFPVPYTENRNKTDFISGVIGHVLSPIDWNRTVYDTTSCATFTELVITNPKGAYYASNPDGPAVVGMRMQFDDKAEHIIKMDSIVTRPGDWLFNATSTLQYYKMEKPWDVIPAEKRDTRSTLKAAADAYADIFSNHSVVVPFDTPCCRIEGGASTCTNMSMISPEANTCVLGIPDASHPQHLRDRTYVIDEMYGTVQVSMDFAGLPDSHLFRVEEGKIRYVHTMTACGKLGCRITNVTLRRGKWEGRDGRSRNLWRG